MKVVIIEDEKLSTERLSKLLMQIDNNINIVSCLDTIQSAVLWFENNDDFDLVFMDIQLADGSCFEIFDKMELKKPIIFTTAYTDHAIKAFKFNTIDYLLKPIGIKELTNAINKYTNLNFKERNVHYGIDNTDVQIPHYKSRFVVKNGVHLIAVAIENILCFYSQEKAVFLLTKDNKKFLIDYSLDQLELMLNPESFFRINRKYITSLKAIEDITAYSNSRFKINLNYIDDNDILVSRERVGDFKLWLDK